MQKKRFSFRAWKTQHSYVHFQNLHQRYIFETSMITNSEWKDIHQLSVYQSHFAAFLHCCCVSGTAFGNDLYFSVITMLAQVKNFSICKVANIKILRYNYIQYNYIGTHLLKKRLLFGIVREA